MQDNLHNLVVKTKETGTIVNEYRNVGPSFIVETLDNIDHDQYDYEIFQNSAYRFSKNYKGFWEFDPVAK